MHKKYERVTACNTVQINQFLQTTKPNIYAIGDVTGIHTTNNSTCYQAAVAVHNMFYSPNKKIMPQFNTIPHVIRTPYAQLMSLGLSEQEAQRVFNGKIRVYYPHTYSTVKSLNTGYTKPFIKLVCTNTGTIIGIHIIAQDAQEIMRHFTLTDQLNVLHTQKEKHSLLSSPYCDMVYAISAACAQDIQRR